MNANNINLQIGVKIKNLRNANGLTQQDLADRTELTKGYISQLERGLAAPSVSTLLDIIECLGSNAADFFKETEEEVVVFRDEDYFEKIDDAGNSVEWLVPTAQKNMMEPIRMVLKPGECTAEDKPHEGEEFGYVISGKLRLHLGDRIYKVGSGESFYFKSDRRHFVEAVGKKPTKFLWVSTPPSF